MGRILEGLVAERMDEYAEGRGLVHKQVHGFRKTEWNRKGNWASAQGTWRGGSGRRRGRGRWMLGKPTHSLGRSPKKNISGKKDSTYYCQLVIWSSDHLINMVIWSICSSGQVNMGIWSIWSSNYLIIWSPCHLIIWSIWSSGQYGHLVNLSSGQSVIWSSGHLVIWSSGCLQYCERLY